MTSEQPRQPYRATLVADVVGGETPEIAIDDLGIDRFR